MVPFAGSCPRIVVKQASIDPIIRMVFIMALKGIKSIG
jgi:hypothetical protein